MTEFTHMMTLAERQRLASQVRLLLQQPQLSDHHDFDDVKTTLMYLPMKANRQKGRRKQAAQQVSSLECQENGLGLVCELVTAKGRDKVRARSSGDRFAVLVASKGSDGSHHFSVAIIDAVSRNLDVILGDEAEVTIVGIQPSVFLHSLCEVAAAGANVRDSGRDAEISGVPGTGTRRPRHRAATSIWNIREWFTLKGFILRVLFLSALREGYRRLKYEWAQIDSIWHYYHGRMPPDLWNSPDMQRSFELAKSLQRLHGYALDGQTYQALFAKRELANVNDILTAVFVDVPKLCLSAYILISLVARDRTGPFYRSFCFEAAYLAWDEYRLLVIHQIYSVAFSKTSFAQFGEHMWHEVARIFYICLLYWNPADRTHRWRFLVRSLAVSIVLSILFTAIWYSPFFFKSNEPRVVDLNEFAKMYQLPELRPSDMRNIPFVTN